MRTLVLSALLFSALVGPLIAGTLYVDVNNATPLAPFGSWASASTNIQDAIDAAIPGDLVLVTNGNYQFGEYFVSGVVVPSRVAVNKSLTVASVNGPAVTIIHGRKGGRTSLRGVYLADGAILSGFTITNGTANIEQLQGTGLGGGVYCQSAAAVVTNCVINGNQGLSGGAVYQGTLHNCAWAQQYGLPTDGSQDLADSDDDGANNWSESRADTNPTNALSLLRVLSATPGQTGARVTWQGTPTRNYFVQRATNLQLSASAISSFRTIGTNILGSSGTNVFTDTKVTAGGTYLYRVGVP
jgi:hypothetical protein